MSLPSLIIFPGMNMGPAKVTSQPAATLENRSLPVRAKSHSEATLTSCRKNEEKPGSERSPGVLLLGSYSRRPSDACPEDRSLCEILRGYWVGSAPSHMCAMLWRSAALLLCILPLLSVAQLPVCTRVQACAARLDIYPLLEEDSSGWGSGLVPLYDEAFEPTTFDYTQTPETTTFELCECANNRTCDSDVDQRNLRLDDTVKLTFCDEVQQQLPLQCKGHRGIPRVIGIAHPSGETVTTVSSTAVFCTCPSGYERLRPEYWGGAEISISYKCK